MRESRRGAVVSGWLLIAYGYCIYGGASVLGRFEDEVIGCAAEGGCGRL